VTIIPKKPVRDFECDPTVADGTGDNVVYDVAFYDFEERKLDGTAIFAYVCARDVSVGPID
jgi:hypothetical protein